MRFGLRDNQGVLWITVTPEFWDNELAGVDIDVELIPPFSELSVLNIAQWCNECALIINTEFGVKDDEGTMYHTVWQFVNEVLKEDYWDHLT